MFCGAKLLKKNDVRKCARHFSSFPSIFPHFRTPTQARKLYAYLSKIRVKNDLFWSNTCIFENFVVPLHPILKTE